MPPNWVRRKEEPPASPPPQPDQAPVAQAPVEKPAAGGTAPEETPPPKRNPADRLKLWTPHQDPVYERRRQVLAEINTRIYDELQRLSPDATTAMREDVARKAAFSAIGQAKPPVKEGQVTILVEKALSRLDGRLGPLQQYMDDDSVSEILVNAFNEVWVERAGRLERTPVCFEHDDEVENLVSSLASRVGARFDNSAPILDCRLEDGSRLAAVRWPVAARGTLVSIRKFSNMPNLSRGVAQGAVPSVGAGDRPSFTNGVVMPVGLDTVDFVRWSVVNRIPLVFYGGTSTGKTTMMNMFMEVIPASLRVIIIEDSLELQPPPELHVVRLVKREGNIEGKGEITLGALLKASLRLRPDIIVVGECRKDEVAVLFEAWNTGHDGGMTSVHASGPMECIDRMARMLVEGKPSMTLEMATRSMAKTLKVLVQMNKDASPKAAGRRVMQRITAVEGLDERGNAVLNDLYAWTSEGWSSTGHIPVWAKGAAAE